MTKPRIAVALFVAVLAAAAWLAWRSAAAPGLAPVEAAPTPASGAVAAAATAAAPTVDPADAPTLERTAAALPADAPRPLPTDAPWVEVLVVDGATDAPVADAEVHWIDEEAANLVRKKLGSAAAIALGWQPIEATAARAGWRTRSDAQGRARVTVRDATEVAAAHGGRYGTLALRGNTVTPSRGHRLRLQPDRALQLRVTDAAGATVADVPVTVGTRNGFGNPIGRYSWQPRARTGGDGLATIPHLQLVEDEFRRETANANEEPPPYAHFAKICLPGCDDVCVDFDLAAPAQPIELRLPAHGSLRVRAELLGQLLPDFHTAGLVEQVDPSAPDAQRWQQRQRQSVRSVAVGDDGFARFPHVPLGKRWTVSTDAAGGIQDVVAGPTAPGQEVTVVLTPGQARCVVRGRALAAAGAPLSSTQLRVAAHWGTDRAMAAITTDDDGRFVASLSPNRDATAAATLTVAALGGDAAPRRVELRDRRISAGVLDLGDLVLADWPALVRGRLTRDGAPCAGPCGFEITREERSPGKPARWRQLFQVVSHVAPDGSFSVHGDPAPGAHRLRAKAPDGAQSEQVDFQPGAKDLGVDLVARHPLAASTLLPAGARGGLVAFELVAVTPPQRNPSGAPRLWRASPEDRPAPIADVRWPPLLAGRYELRVALAMQPTPLVVIPDVVVPSPPGGDPRLREIDLRALVRVVTIALQSADGARLTNPEVFLASNTTTTDTVRGLPSWAAENAYVLPAGPYDLTAYVNGFRPHALRGDADRVEARLEPWPVVELRFGDAPALGAGVTLHARLVPTAPPSPARWETVSGNGPLDDFARAPQEWRRVRDGVARVPVGDGVHRLEVKLQRAGTGETRLVDGAFVEGGSGAAPVADVAPATLAWTGAPVAVTAPAAAWQAALAALAKPAKPAGAGSGK